MPLDDLVSVIETLQQRIRDHRATLQGNETRTRMALIDPLLTALGWDVSDPALVTPEYHGSGGGGWADYGLVATGNKLAAVIEAKRLGSTVENHLSQAVGYCIAEGIAYAGVTDGNHWQLYRTFDQVPMEEKRVLDVRLADTAAYECALQLLLLWRPNVASGKAAPAAEPVLADAPAAEPVLASAPAAAVLASAPAAAQEPAHEPVRPLKPVQPDQAQDWVALSSYQPEAKPPTAIRFSDDTERPVQYWRHLVENVAAWLWSTGKLTRSDLPIRTGRGRRYIVSLSPFHADGADFIAKFAIAGTPIHYEGNISKQQSLSCVIILLQHCGVNPDSIFLTLRSTNFAPGPPVQNSTPVESTATQPLSQSSNMTAEANPKWVPLPNFHPPIGSDAPTAIKFPDGVAVSLSKWKELPRAVAGWLYDRQLLTRETLPIASGPRGYAANDTPVMPDGQPMTTYDTIGNGNIFINVHVSATAARGNASKMLEHCGVKPDTVYLQAGQ